VERVDPNALEPLEVKRFHLGRVQANLLLRSRASHQLPQTSALYTKVAKSAKKKLEVVSFFVLFATLV
jgi:hypothetical protein